MPELPEVEQFRRILLPLVSTKGTERIFLELMKNENNPPRKWLSPNDIEQVSGKFYCQDVKRKGKLICMVLVRNNEAAAAANKKYLYLHMGMTGRITAPSRSCRLENVKQEADGVFPPSHTYLLLRTTTSTSTTSSSNSATTQDYYQVAFSDPRKFGSAHLCDDTSLFDQLAPDALEALHNNNNHNHNNSSSSSSSTNDDSSVLQVLPKLVNQARCIKALLLDQKRAVSGVGNWVADEVLYQSALHPDQSYLTESQAQVLCEKLRSILITAVDCLDQDQEYPDSWLFGYRWTKKKKTATTDAKGRPIKFVTSGGRTSAIVESIQKLYKTQRAAPPPPIKAEDKTLVSSSAQKIMKQPSQMRETSNKKEAALDNRATKVEEEHEDGDDSGKQQTKNKSKKAANGRKSAVKKRVSVTTTTKEEEPPKKKTKTSTKIQQKKAMGIEAAAGVGDTRIRRRSSRLQESKG